MATSITIPLTPTQPPAIGQTVIPHTSRITYQDMIEYMVDFFGSSVAKEVQAVARRAILAATRELTNSHEWTYFYTHGRIQVNGQQTTGTVQVQVSSGALPNYVTLTGATFPSWTASGSIRIGTVVYDVDRYIDSTHCTLVAGLAPTADIAAGTSYALYRDTYTLPEDCVAVDQFYPDISWGAMGFVHPRVWMQTQRYAQSYANTPRFYTVMGDPKVKDRLCMRIMPYPDQDRTLDFVYKRRPRKLTIDGYSTGTVTIDSVNTPQTVIGSGTVWTSSVIGSVLRLSSTKALPTSLAGGNPAAYERNIATLVSSTNLTTDDVAGSSFTGSTYLISDPIDIEDGAMLEAFYRCCEKHGSMMRNMKDKADFDKQYRGALILAKEADSRSIAPRSAGSGNAYRPRLAQMPMGADVP